MVITRGAAPSDVLREALSEAQSVTFWMQRDVPKRDGTIPSEQWLVRCQKLLPESVRQGRRVDPPAGFKDWNDALWELSPDAFRDVVALADKEGRALESLGRSGLSNNQPVPLPDALLPVPAFDPDHLLPPVLRDYVVDGAERVQVDPAFVAIPLIVSIGSLMGNRIFLRPKLNDDWGECPNVWGAIVGRPSTLKSPAMSHAMRPLHSLQNAANAAHKEAMAGFRKEAAVGEIKRQAAKQEALKAARKGDEIDGELLVEEENQAPAGRRFVTSDPGPEALHQLLCQPENAHGILIFQDELTGVLARMADQERGAVLRVLMLAGWNGNQSFVVDRIGRGLNLQVSKCCVSVLGGIQPGKLAPLIDGAVRESVDDDGWVQRLSLLVWPDPIKEYKALDNAPNRAAFDAVMGLLAKLEATPGDGFPGAVFDDGQQQHFLRLSPEASTVFVQWVVDETNALRQGEQLAAVESHFFKMRKTVLALALIFHVALEWDTPKVSLSCLNLALRWCDYLKAHAMRVYGSSRSSCSATAERILRKLRSGDLPATFTARDLKRRAWSGLTDAKTIESALELLADHGWLTEVARPTGGRWTTDYTAHPTVFEKPSERTAKTDKRAFGSFGSDQTRHSQTK
jgi:putative DNA primase/helicase